MNINSLLIQKFPGSFADPPLIVPNVPPYIVKFTLPVLYDDNFRNHEEFIKTKLGLNEKAISILMNNSKYLVTNNILIEFVTHKKQDKEQRI